MASTLYSLWKTILLLILLREITNMISELRMKQNLLCYIIPPEYSFIVVNLIP